MMKVNLLYHLIIFKLAAALITPFQQDELSNFKEGKFIYKGEAFNGILVKRTEHSQIESIGDSLYSYFNIQWSNLMSYILIPDKVIYSSVTTLLPKDTIKVRIINILSDSSYRYQAVVNGDTTEHIMIKIH